MIGTCLDPHEIDAWVEGDAEPSSLDRFEEHVDACARCRELVGHLLREQEKRSGSDSLAGSDTVVEPATAGARVVRGRGVHRIDRYVVERELGAGGMGVVYLASDPELHRSIVIKVLRHPASARPQDHSRMLREAQAMARVSHANVVPIYDVGVHDEQVFIAMEYIDGCDLARWCERRHPVREVLAVMIAAGRGLAAAHRAGLVHRDFKPANVMLAKSGEVKVTDFGLARGDHASDGELPVPRSEALIDTPITRTGAVVGTPAYMAPEQIRGRTVDARTDQFSFCVTLYEALFGERPFSGATVDELFE
jgi:eukaryotic-like serine/threonine-protein kinase